MIRPLEWMRAVRDADPPFTTPRLAVLLCLALRMDSTGHGFASANQLASDAGVYERTARRATDEARGRGYLNRTRRGHRLGNGKVVASQWELTLPTQGVTGVPLTQSQPVTGDPLTQSQRDTGDPLTQSQPVRTHSQPVTGDRPRGLSPRGLSASARAAAIVAEKTDATEAEAAAVVALIAAERPTARNLAAVVGRIATAGELPDWLERVRAEGNRAALAEWNQWRKAQPPCPHDEPGGELPRPDNGQPMCPLCRHRHRTHDLTATAAPA